MAIDKLIIKSKTQKLLIKNIKENTLPNTIIFYGPKHSGKLTSAYYIAKTLNCLEKINDFCDICPNCKKINSFSHPDLSILNSYITDDKIKAISNLIKTNNNPKIIKTLNFQFDELVHSFLENKYRTKPKPDTIKTIENIKIFINKCNNTNEIKNLEKKINQIQKISEKIYNEVNYKLIHIESIRKIIKNIYAKPIEAKNKVTIINGAENMRVETANTLLKAIEEPPEYNTIILITRNINKIIHTIRSRATLVYFPPINKELMPHILKNKLDLNKETVTENKSIWDYIKKQNPTKDKSKEFISKIAPNYNKENKIFIFTDKLIEDKVVKDFLKEIIILSRNAKLVKYNAKNVSKDNFLHLLNNKEIDSIKNRIEDIIYRIENFNANVSLNLTALLISISRQIRKAAE